MNHLLKTTAIVALMASPLAADEVADTLESALTAYQDGDIQYALEELEYAKQLMLSQKTDALTEFLPPAPEGGWTREINTEMNAALGMMGGGVGAEAEYTGPGQSFTISIMADNPMVGAMAGMIGNAAALGAKVVRVKREKFMVQNDEMRGLVDRRILVQASGGDIDTMTATLETMDFRSLGKFGQ